MMNISFKYSNLTKTDSALISLVNDWYMVIKLYFIVIVQMWKTSIIYGQLVNP